MANMITANRNDPARLQPTAISTMGAEGNMGCLGMILDFGDKRKKDESQPLIECPRCGKETVYTAERQRWVEILMIPMIPLGKKVTILVCSGQKCPWAMEKERYEQAQLDEEVVKTTPALVR